MTTPPRWLVLTGDVVAGVYPSFREAWETAVVMAMEFEQQSPLGDTYATVEVVESRYFYPGGQPGPELAAACCPHGTRPGEYCPLCLGGTPLAEWRKV